MKPYKMSIGKLINDLKLIESDSKNHKKDLRFLIDCLELQLDKKNIIDLIKDRTLEVCAACGYPMVNDFCLNKSCKYCEVN